MTIPFLDLFKKLVGRSESVETAPTPTPAPARVVRPKKPEGERLSKTVMPHTTRSFSAPDPFRAAAGGPGSPQAPSLQLGTRKITASPSAKRSPTLPPALARALEPKLERAISLRIADFIDRVPAGYIKPVEILDAAARVSLKASEIEKGMPDKHPTISLPSLYQQVPEIFIRGVRPDDETRVALPYDKVLEQIENLHVRADQVRDPAVPQLETPILTATVKDAKRFGTKIEPIESAPLPPVSVQPATAQAIADAEPEAIVHEKTDDRSTLSGHRVISLHSPELTPKSELPPPKKIPFDFSPNGTGVPASERVPASSGPPVPTTLPFSPELAKIAVGPPAETVKARPSEPTKAPPSELSATPVKLIAETVSTPTKDEAKITLALKPLWQNLPAFQLSDESAEIRNDEKVTFPLNLIESQLASGRITISAEIFQAALPEQHRAAFQIDEAKTAVSLPLEEILKNLPATVLKLRGDQEQLTLDKDFETPFSTKAREDAERLHKESATAAKVSDKAPEQPVVEAKIGIEPVSPVETPAVKAAEKVDPKEIVAQASALAGVKACTITFSDGLSLAGNLPDEIAADGLCAMAPSLLERIDQHMRESKLGELVTMTLHSAESAISFFARENICLTVLHANGELTKETRAELAALAGKLSRTYAKSE
jgi:predicted regulator of Ras-like GTPase activity (Roadblock/LC7/MglB family)